MRIVHDVEGEMQACASVYGSHVTVSMFCDDEEIHIEGSPQCIAKMLRDALEALESVLAAKAEEHK